MPEFPPHTLAIAKARSNNSKIGDAATTYAAQASCPAGCPFFDNGGCYAEAGSIGKFVTAPLNRAAGGADPIAVAVFEAYAIACMEVIPGRPLRLHTVGDCASDQAAKIVAAAVERYMARGGGPVWTYTHGWREVERASWGSISVLASCESFVDVLAARARGYATAIVVEEFESDKRYAVTQPGQSESSSVFSTSHEAPKSEVLPCPQQTRGVACSECRLCFDDAGLLERGYSIGFELHGTPFTVRQGRKALRAPDDPERRLTSHELIPRYLAEHPGATTAQIARDLGLAYASVSEMRATLAREAA